MKTRRLELRVDEDAHRAITEAAALLRVSRSAFVADAARQAAEKVIVRPEVTPMSAEVFDRMVASLSEPEDSQELADLAALPRRVTR